MENKEIEERITDPEYEEELPENFEEVSDEVYEQNNRGDLE